jgi:hypothetical protein
MSTDNPYNAPSPAIPSLASPAPPRTVPVTQPNGFTAICVLSIILGGMGTLVSVFGLIALVAAPAIQSLATMQQPGQPQALHDLNVKMQKDVAEITDRWKPFSYALVAIHLALSLGILMGAIYSLKRNPTGVPLLLFGMMAAVGYEALNLLMQIVIQTETFPITARYMKDVMEATPGNKAPAEMGEFMSNAMTFGMWITIGILVAWTLAKVVFDIITILYIQRKDVQAYIGVKPTE